MGDVCVDASFALKLVLPEAHSTEAHALRAKWLHDDVTLVAPWLWLFEVQSVLRRKVARRELTDIEAREGWSILRRQGIRSIHPRGLFELAWKRSLEFDRPTTYDTVYLAAAELRGCEFWTADQRLVNALGGKLDWVRSVAYPDIPPGDH